MSETSEPTEAQIAFARRWLFADMRDAFPEMPVELIAEAARLSAPSTARALNEADRHAERLEALLEPHIVWEDAPTQKGDDDGR